MTFYHSTSFLLPEGEGRLLVGPYKSASTALAQQHQFLLPQTEAYGFGYHSDGTGTRYWRCVTAGFMCDSMLCGLDPSIPWVSTHHIGFWIWRGRNCLQSRRLMLMFISSSTHPNPISLNGALKIVIDGQNFVISSDNTSRPKSETTEVKRWTCDVSAWVGLSRSSHKTPGGEERY